MPITDPRPWLLLVHAIPPKPDYLRVKVGRRLARVGAVAVKNSVYVLPQNDEAAEDFQWVLREVVAGGGECTICEATFVAGLTDDRVIALFRAARDADYAEIGAAAAALRASLDGVGSVDPARRAQVSGEIAKLRRRCGEVSAIDYFHADGGTMAESAIRAVEAALHEAAGSDRAVDAPSPADAVRSRTWVTRRGIKVDRISSAWLIRRFIDPDARIRFVDPEGFRPEREELRFDMFDAEYTHEGPRCTFETLVHRFALDDPALVALGEIVHDIDFKEHVFGREETAGVARLIDGLTLAHTADEDRLRDGSALFDALYSSFSSRGVS
jgi:hypothetical protein